MAMKATWRLLRIVNRSTRGAPPKAGARPTYTAHKLRRGIAYTANLIPGLLFRNVLLRELFFVANFAIAVVPGLGGLFWIVPGLAPPGRGFGLWRAACKRREEPKGRWCGARPTEAKVNRGCARTPVGFFIGRRRRQMIIQIPPTNWIHVPLFVHMHLRPPTKSLPVSPTNRRSTETLSGSVSDSRVKVKRCSRIPVATMMQVIGGQRGNVRPYPKNFVKHFVGHVLFAGCISWYRAIHHICNFGVENIVTRLCKQAKRKQASLRQEGSGPQYAP